MEWLKNFRTRFRSLWLHPKVKREIGEEPRFHLEQRTVENIVAGMTPSLRPADAGRELRPCLSGKSDGGSLSPA